MFQEKKFGEKTFGNSFKKVLSIEKFTNIEENVQRRKLMLLR